MVGEDGLQYIRLKDGARVIVNTADTNVRFGHVSCHSSHKDGRCFYSSTRDGALFTFELGIDSSQGSGFQDENGLPLLFNYQTFEQWGNSRSTADEYLAQPRATVSPGGNQVIYASDWFGKGPVHAYLKRSK